MPVSLSMVVQLCRTLEREGSALEARPRAGYFVRPRRPLASLQAAAQRAGCGAVCGHSSAGSRRGVSQRYPAR